MRIGRTQRVFNNNITFYEVWKWHNAVGWRPCRPSRLKCAWQRQWVALARAIYSLTACRWHESRCDGRRSFQMTLKKAAGCFSQRHADAEWLNCWRNSPTLSEFSHPTKKNGRIISSLAHSGSNTKRTHSKRTKDGSILAIKQAERTGLVWLSALNENSPSTTNSDIRSNKRRSACSQT